MNSISPNPMLLPAAGRRFLTGLLGAPIAHSASPAMHERAAEALGARCHYQLIEVAGASREDLKRLLDGVRGLGFSGINVTFPYKEAVMELLDSLSPGAQAVGAVNTVVVADGKLTGHNTDATGFARAVTPLVTESAHGPVAVIGTGGVGKAIAFALAGLGVSELRILDTDLSKAEHLAALLRNYKGIRIAANLGDALDGAVGVVNGTPVGMLPSTGTPVPVALLRADLWVADAVYSPLWTPLLKAARATGAKVMTGRDLAIYQAADAFELFTGLAASTHEMGIAFDAVMEKRYSSAT